MATYSVNRAKHATLVADTKDIVNFAYSGVVLRVRNRGTSGDIYFSFDGIDPTVAGDDSYFCAPGENVVVEAIRPALVELISSGTPAYSVELY